MTGFFRNMGWLLGSRAVNALLSLIYLALATRGLGLAEFGRFSLIVVLGQALAGLATFQTWQAIVRHGGNGRAGEAGGFALALDIASMAAGVPLAIALCWSAPIWLPLPPELRLVALVQCLAALLAIRSTPTGLLRLSGRYDLAALADSVLPLVRAGGAIAAFLAGWGVAGFVAAWALAELACAATYWFLALRLTPIGWGQVSIRDLPAREAGLWRFVWATNLSRSLAVSGRQVLLLLVGALGGAALAGGYRIAAQIGQALLQLAEVSGRALYPELVRAGEGARAMAGRMAAMALATGIGAVVLAQFAGPLVIAALAGAQFQFVHGALVILALAGSFELLSAGWDALLVAEGRPELSFVLRAAALGLALAMLPAAIVRWQLVGVAFCVLGSSALCAAGFAWLAVGRCALQAGSSR